MLRTKALLIALVAASADAANLRASERRLAGHGGHADGDDPEWHHESSASRLERFGIGSIFSCLRVFSLFTRRASAACMSGVVIGAERRT